jgi:hypothetical protein
MRMPRFRFTIRRMMVAVAIVALASGAIVADRQAKQRVIYAKKAKHHALGQAIYQQQRDDFASRFEWDLAEAENLRDRGKGLRQDALGVQRWDSDQLLHNANSLIGYGEYRIDFLRSQLRVAKLRVDFHATMKQKYERLARYPWLPVAPDPPEPK